MSDGAYVGKSESAVVFNATQVRRARELLARLSGARRAQRLYPAGHPAVRELAEGVMFILEEYFAEGVDVPLTFFDDELLLGERTLPEDSILFDQLIRDLSAIGANAVTFRTELKVEELERALPVLSADASYIASRGGLEALVAAADIPNVVIATVRVYERDETSDGEGDGDVPGKLRPIEDREAAKQSYLGAIDVLRELDRVIRDNRVAAADRVRGVVRGLVDNVLANRFAMLELTGLKDYDEYTFFHSVNVAILSLALGSLVTSDRRFLNSLGVGALLHDIGKMTIEIGILNKPGALSSDEWAKVRNHPVYGAEVAATMPGLDRAAMPVILEHHMRFDLDGYPDVKPRRPQHVTSRIVAVADAYDAMTSRRSYSSARLQDEAMEVLAKNAGTAFDPVLVRLFVEMLGIYPPRAVVRLTSGEVGIVVHPSPTDVLRPTVRIIADASGDFVDPVDVDLSDPEAAAGRGVAACLDAAGMNVDVADYL